MVISPEAILDFGIFDMNKIDAIFNLGYITTKKLLEEQHQDLFLK